MKTKFFKNWNIKKSILAPVLANLTTAFTLFLVVLLFKDPIYRLFKPNPKVESFPLYCIAEPYNDAEGKVVSDLFIVNTKEEKYTEESLKENLKKSGSIAPDVPVTPHIMLEWKRKLGRIVSVLEDEPFNLAKGKLEIEQADKDGKKWAIKVKEISGEAILKLTVLTDYEIPISRNAKASLPFEVVYPGK